MMLTFDKPSVSPVLVGRKNEVDIFERTLQAVAHGSGQTLLVTGEAGVGKSRLLAEVCRLAENMSFLTLQGHCFEPDVTFPYAPLIDALRFFFAAQPVSQIAHWLGPLAAELVKLLPELTLVLPDLEPTSSLAAETEKRRLFEALAQFLTRLIGATDYSSLLLIIEDIHWSDETSLDFLHFFARRLAAFPVLLIASYRHEEITPILSETVARLNQQRLAQEIYLKRLEHGETDTLLQAIFELNRPIRSDFLDTIFALTEGNPFFIEEVVKSLIAAGDIFYTSHGWDRKPIPDLRIPHSVQDAVQQRLAKLSEPAQSVLTLAAVAGRRFDFNLLHTLTDYDEAELLKLIKEMIAAQLVIEESAERFAFRHALTRQAIYANLLARERQSLHYTIAQAIENVRSDDEANDRWIADLAYHFYEAGVWEKALIYGQRAGKQALRRYALNAAIEHFSRALNASGSKNEAPLPDLYRSRARAYETIGVFEPALSDLEAALETARAAGDNTLEWELLLELGMLWVSRDYSRAGDFYRQALNLARLIDDPATLGYSLNRLGNYLINLDKPFEARQYQDEALTIFEQLQDQSGLAETLDLLGTTLVVSGDWVEGAAHYQRAAAEFRQLDNRQGLASSLTMLTFRGGAYLNDTMVILSSFNEALRDGEEALEIAHQTGQRAAESLALSAMAFCLGPQGEFDRALSLARTGLSIAEQIEHRHWITFSHLALGAVYLDHLAITKARNHLEQALSLAQEVGSRFFHNLAGGFLSSVYILNNDLDRAETVLNDATLSRQELEEYPPSTSRGQVWRAWIELALARNNFKMALQIIDRLIALAPNVTETIVIPRLWYLRGQALLGMGRLTEAETLLQVALSTSTKQGFRPLCWRIQASLVKLHLTQRRYPQAEAAQLQAQTLIKALATNISDGPERENFVSRALQLLPELPPLSPRRVAKRAFDGLTRRERQVATLVAHGKSNREIAEALIVSERTAATHVGNILNKLGYSSRVQIASWAIEKGLLKDE